jgi:hypothetical protein
MADTFLVIGTGPTVNIVIGGSFDFVAYFASLPEYDSDESAIDPQQENPLSIGDVYRTSDNHVSLPGGVLKQIRTI